MHVAYTFRLLAPVCETIRQPNQVQGTTSTAHWVTILTPAPAENVSTSRDIERYAALFASRTKVMKSSAMRDLMAVTARPEVISLAGGLPDTSTFFYRTRSPRWPSGSPPSHAQRHSNTVHGGTRRD